MAVLQLSSAKKISNEVLHDRVLHLLSTWQMVSLEALRVTPLQILYSQDSA